MVELRYAADAKESDYLTRRSATRTNIFARIDTAEKRLFFKLRGATLAAHPEETYPELWRAPIKELKSVEPQLKQFTVRLDKSVLVLEADDEDTYQRWVEALRRSAGTEFEKFYKRERNIGKGHFSQVYVAADRNTGDKFAVKVIKKDKNDLEKSKKFIRREVKVLSITDHPNLIKAVDFFSSGGKPHIVMEYISGGSLREMIRKQKRLSEDEARPIMRGILGGLAYLHEMNIVHRDIKPENILMVTPEFPKLSDFGLSTFRNEDKQIHSMVGTPSYVAPEIMRGVPYGPPADVWSCGIVLYFMFSGERPYTGETREDIKRSVLDGELRFPSQLFGKCSPELKSLISLMLNFDQRSRISASDALAHPWVTH